MECFLFVCKARSSQAAKKITIIVLIILSAVTIKTVTDMRIIQFAINGTEEYSKAQDKEMEDFGKIENLLTDTISNIESGNTNATPSEPDEPVNNLFTDADIGKYVNYVPVGTDYTAEAKYSGCTDNQVFSQDTNLKWQIWKVENDILYLISDVVPNTSGYNNTGKLYLKGTQGYNNGVTLLDNICQTNYGVDGNTNIKIQNLKLEDVLEVKADKIDQINGSIYETQPCTYPLSGTFAFPSIWYSNERESLELAQKNKSIAYALIEEAYSTTISSNEKPYYTLWVNQTMNNVSAWKNEKYHNMVMNPAKSKVYWLSSRCVCPNGTTNGFFSLQAIGTTGVGNNGLYGCNINTSSVSGEANNIRPLILIPLKDCKITENITTENTFDIVIK